MSTYNLTGLRLVFYSYLHVANTFQQQNKVILINCLEDVVIVVMGKSAEGEGRIRASSHSLQRWQHASPNTPLASLLLVLLREGHEAGKCQAWGSPTALLCIKQSLGIPVLSSNPYPNLSAKNLHPL